MNIYKEDLKYPDDLDKNLFWEGNDFIILLKNDEYIRLENMYLSSFSFGDLEQEPDENVLYCNRF